MRKPPRVRLTRAVLSPAETAPLLPMTAKPSSTESEPERETPSSETVAIEGCEAGEFCACAVDEFVKDAGCGGDWGDVVEFWLAGAVGTGGFGCWPATPGASQAPKSRAAAIGGMAARGFIAGSGSFG